MNAATETTTLRLGPLEEFLAIAHDRFGASGTGTVVLRLRGALAIDRLAAALRTVQARHPRLRATIQRPSRKDVILHVADIDSAPPIPIREVAIADGADAWKAHAIANGTARFDVKTGPLCRVTILSGGEPDVHHFVLSFHHAIIDAPALFTLLDETFTALASEPSRAVDRLPLVPVPDGGDGLSFPGKVRGIAEGLWAAFHPPVGLGENTDPDSAFVSTVVLSAPETDALLARCHAERVSLHAVLSAAGLLAARRIAAAKDARLAWISSVNTRHLVQPAIGEEHMGCFVSSFRKAYTLRGDERIWDVARTAHTDLSGFLFAGGPLRMLALMKWAGISDALFAAPRDTLIVSTLGAGRMRDRYDGLAIEEVALLGNVRHIGTWLGVLSTILGDRLHVTLGGIYLNPATVATFCEIFSTLLREAVGPVPETAAAPAPRPAPPPSSTDPSPTIAALTEIFREVFEDPDLRITRATSARDIASWDSLKHVVLVLAAERRFTIRMSSSQVAGLNDVGALADVIDRLTTSR